jgi:hypothetical protein
MKQLEPLTSPAAAATFLAVDRPTAVPQHKTDTPSADQHTALLLLGARQCRQPENPDNGLLSAHVDKILTVLV